MNRWDWLLLLLAQNPHDNPGPVGLDPIRIQKALFLVSKRGPAPDLYKFRPYHWGPFSSEIYRDLESLAAQGLVAADVLPGQTWRIYRATSAGEARAESLANGIAPDDVQWIGEARRYVTSVSFLRLLREMYSAYPEYATESVLNQHAAP